MNKLGKFFRKNFMRRTFALILACAVAASGMPSYAAESGTEAAQLEAEESALSEASSASLEESAEESEEAQIEKETPETQNQDASSEPQKESEAGSDAAAEPDKAEKESSEKPSSDAQEDAEETQAKEADNKAAITDAKLGEGHINAKWDFNGTIASSNNKLESSNGTYTNAAGDVLFVDASVSGAKFAPNSADKKIQANIGTKIYIPVKAVDGKAKIAIYQSGVSKLDNLEKASVDNSNAAKSWFNITGENLGEKTKTLGSAVNMNSTNYYKAEWTFTLTNNVDSTVICVEIKDKTNYLTKIISGEEVREDVYGKTEGDSADLVKYNIEGYAGAYGVTGGGVMKTDAANYHTAASADAFLNALKDIKAKGEPAVIKVTGDLNLGSKEVSNFATYSSIIKEHTNQPLLHPTLTASGVSILNLAGFKDLTIFSTNGASIKHCGIVISDSKNIIIRNITFDELWEWDEQTSGAYDRNDWDYIGIEGSDKIWIDHCTFYKAYDGIIDIKNPNTESNVTISWCRFLPASKVVDGEPKFFNDMMNHLETNKASTTYYKELRDTKNLTQEQVKHYAYGHKKTHLLGQSDDASNAAGIKLTLANNYYFDSMDRMPRLRFGTVHEYNCVLDSQELYTWKKSNNVLGDKITSNGAISTCDGKMLLENCYINGIGNPLNSGNGSSPTGYINAVDSLYFMDGADKTSELKPKKNGDGAGNVLTTDVATFIEALPYTDYIKYPASSLNTDAADSIKKLAGAGVVTMSDIQWTKTSYGDRTGGGTQNPPTQTKYNVIVSYGTGSGSYAPGATVTVTANQTSPGKHFKEWTATGIALTAEQAKQTPLTFTMPAEDVTVTAEYENDTPTTYTVTVTGGTITGGTDTTRSYAEGDNVSITANAPETGKRFKQWTVTGITLAEEQAKQSPLTFTMPANAVEVTAEYEPIPSTPTEITFSLSADEIEIAEGSTSTTITTDTEKNGFTIKADTTQTVVVDKNKKTIDNKTINQRIKLVGAGSASSRSIHFKAETAGTLTVFLVSASSDVRKCQLFKSGSSTALLEKDAGKDPAKETFAISEPGDYYIAGNAGINIYYIEFTNKKTGEGGGEEKPAGPESMPQFNAPAGDKVYGAAEGNEQSKVIYNMEGYAAAANVTGGGLLKKGESANYYTVNDEKEFLAALDKIRGVKDKPNVIEITKDLNLGNLELKDKHGLNITSASGGDYSGVIRAYGEGQTPLMHPTLIQTGVSCVKLNGFYNLTIFSKNGAAIKHAGILFEGDSNNIIIRNLTFDELWEWDEGGKDAKGKDCKAGDYDRNGWDYIGIQEEAEGIWIDHCTFYKAYDGIIDMKNKSKDYKRITISWCEFLPGSKNNTFFNAQMEWLEKNIDSTQYYKELRTTDNKTSQAVWWYAYGQKKTHLFGDDDGSTQDKAIRATFANNYYKNSMDRLPRLRFGIAHEYNCVLDSHQLYLQYKAGNSITSNGAISTCNGKVLLENCYIRDIRNPLNSGNGSSSTGYINAVGSIYYLDNAKVALEPKKSGTGSGDVLTTDEAAFKEFLPYTDYIKYDATKLYTNVVPNAGAGKLTMSELQWEKTSYGTRAGNEGSTTSTQADTEPAVPNDELPQVPDYRPDVPDPTPVETPQAPTADPAPGEVAKGTTVTLTCAASGATIYYTTDGSTPTASSTLYNALIPIDDAVTIKAIAVNGEGEAAKTSPVAEFAYTVKAETPDQPPVDTPAAPTASPAPGAVEKDTVVTLTCAAAGAKIYYTTDGTDPITSSTRQPNKPITISEAVTIKAVAVNGEGEAAKTSPVAEFVYTVKAQSTDPTPDDPAPVEKPSAPTADPAPGEVAQGTTVTLTCTASGAKIYYTTNGDIPTASSIPYTAPITINEAVTIKAIAVNGAGENVKTSDVAVFAYTVKETEPQPEKGFKIEIEGAQTTYTADNASFPAFYYTGDKITPSVKVTDLSTHDLLAQGVDYTVTYGRNNKGIAGQAEKVEVIVNGRGNYVTGRNDNKKEAYFYIIPAPAPEVNEIKNLKGVKLETIAPQNYTGSPIYPDITLTDPDKARTKTTYEYKDGVYKNKETNSPIPVAVTVSNNINRGTATVYLQGSPDPKDKKQTPTTIRKTFRINPVNFRYTKVNVYSDAACTDESITAEYAVTGAVPGKIYVKAEGIAYTLEKDRDYTLRCSNNRSASGKNGAIKGRLTITGKGNFTGSYSYSFDIEKLDLSKCDVKALAVYELMKASSIREKAATITDTTGNALKASQYMLDVNVNGAKPDKNYKLQAGDKITVSASAKDTYNLTGKTADKEFTVGKDIYRVKVELTSKTGKPYIGKPIKLIGEQDFKLYVMVKNPTTRRSEKKYLTTADYEVVEGAYVNNINRGTARAVIIGKGEYSGTKTISFKIVQRTMSE